MAVIVLADRGDGLQWCTDYPPIFITKSP